jgi:hypothetical protein
MKSEARKLLQELVESWKDFDLAMKTMASGTMLTREEEHYNRTAKASERFQKALGAADAYLKRN